jgi:outer membrane protein assembly factor BamE (lipoprotein component of BamABCDE complex)
MKLLIFIVFIFIINCSGNKVSNYHGNKLLESKYSKIQVNITNKNDLINLIGQPSTKSNFNKNIWFYFERQKSNQSLLKLGTQKIEKNNVLVVELNEKGLLKNKKLYNLDNMNDLKFLKEVTNKEFKNKNVFYGVLTSLREKINAPMRNR